MTHCRAFMDVAHSGPRLQDQPRTSRHQTHRCFALATTGCLCGLTLLALLPGCIAENARTKLGPSGSEQIELATLRTTATEPIVESGLPPGLGVRPWSETVVLLPVDGTAHSTPYLQRGSCPGDSRRQLGAFPTLESSFDLDRRPEEDNALDALREHAFAAFDFAIMIPRMFFVAPWRLHHDLHGWYERAAQVESSGAPRSLLMPASHDGSGHSAPPTTPEAER